MQLRHCSKASEFACSYRPLLPVARLAWALQRLFRYPYFRRLTSLGKLSFQHYTHSYAPYIGEVAIKLPTVAKQLVCRVRQHCTKVTVGQNIPQASSNRVKYTPPPQKHLPGCTNLTQHHRRGPANFALAFCRPCPAFLAEHFGLFLGFDLRSRRPQITLRGGETRGIFSRMSLQEVSRTETGPAIQNLWRRGFGGIIF